MITRLDIVKRAKSAVGTGKWIDGAKPHMDDSPPLLADCSGFVRWAMWPLVQLPDGSFNMYPRCKQITREEARTTPASLAFGLNEEGKINHVGICDGDGYVIEMWISDGCVRNRTVDSDGFDLFGDPLLDNKNPPPTDPVKRPDLPSVIYPRVDVDPDIKGVSLVQAKQAGVKLSDYPKFQKHDDAAQEQTSYGPLVLGILALDATNIVNLGIV